MICSGNSESFFNYSHSNGTDINNNNNNNNDDDDDENNNQKTKKKKRNGNNSMISQIPFGKNK